MYLKSLTLKGFKSFADRAHMVFEPGLTVIVGPNGSGKSNVSDAILWVLGEQSAKQLRGQAMEDVVFAGSSARKPVSVAEVDLTLDNSDHTLPVDFEEVVVTRRMYRSGESEYLINGSPARLLDITDILHDSGLGKDTHSIISQGKLDAILTSRPEERRSLIEEAAGISKHKRRRERSLRRLSSMDEHLKRALDVQKEVNRQLKPLERQVERARRHNELSARVSELRTLLSVDDLRRLRQRWSALEKTEADAAQELEQAEASLRERQAELERLQASLEERGRSAGDISESRRRCQSALERLTAGMRLLDEKGRNVERRLGELRDELGRSEERDGTCRQELTEAVAECEANERERAALRERTDAANERVRAARNARRSAEDELGRAQGRLRGAQRERDAASVALAKARDALESARVQDDLFAARIGQLEETAAVADRDADDVERRLGEAKASLARTREEEAASRAVQEQTRTELTRAQQAEGDARRACAAAEARVAALEQAAQAEENATPLAARIAGDAEARRSIRTRVSEVLEVPEELASLVEQVLAASLTGFVADGPQGLVDVARAAERLGASSAGRVAVVVDSGVEVAPPCDGLPGYALAERVCGRPGYEGVVGPLLGGVRVVGTLEEACRASVADPAHGYATPDGSIVRGGRALVGRASDAAVGVLERRRQLRELEGELPGLREAVSATRAAVDEAEKAIAVARAAHDDHARAAARLSGEVSSLSSEAARVRQSAEKARAELARVREQRSQAQGRSLDAEAAVASQSDALAAAELEATDLEGRIKGLQEAFDATKREDRAAHDEANQCQLELARVQERARSLSARRERLEKESAGLEKGLGSTRASVRRHEAMQARVAPLRSRYEALVDAAQERADLLDGKATAAESASAALRRSIELKRTDVADATVAHSRAMAGVSEVKVEKGRLDVQVDAAVKAIVSQKGVVLEEALELPAPEDRTACERELQKLEGELAALGPVNQVAFEEFEALKRRSEYIGEQVADLQHARADLTKILQVIDRKMRSSFVDTFEAVNKNFEEIFSMLFPGGNGHLEMTVPDDPATTGIEVVAQPRGKRVTKMSLLSGGERSLTALGLLFAAYRTRTVPFYVLDEVEAALDDSNLDRLLDAIEVLRKTTQLIVISHQRRTMESADVLYGVSMQADGVSRVISQKLERDGAAAPQLAQER